MSDDKTPSDLLEWLGITDAPRWWVARPLGSMIAVVLALLLVLALVAAFMVLFHTMRMSMSDANGGINLGAGALIVALLGAPFLIWSTVLKHQTLRYQKEGHITDRINKAVEQLGAEKNVKLRIINAEGAETTTEETRPNIEVRIGAILSLERIAQDSTTNDKGRDHVRVMEILCAYIRENSNAHPPNDTLRKLYEGAKAVWEGPEEDFDDHFCRLHAIDPSELSGLTSIGNASLEVPSFAKPRADVAQALQVLGRRTAEQRRVEAAWPNSPGDSTVWPFDTPCPKLPYPQENDPHRARQIESYRHAFDAWKAALADYAGYRLDLRGANLQNANLSAKHPDGSVAVFSGAMLERARMEGAKLRCARLEGADLSFARLEGTDLSCARMEGVNLHRAVLEVANLSSARMDGAYLQFARMKSTNLSSARMDWACLSGAEMEEATLQRAQLQWANLGSARFDESTVWTGAMLHGAFTQAGDFSTTTISAEQVRSIFGSGSVKLPSNILRPAHWPTVHLEPRAFLTELAKWSADPDGYTPPDPPPKATNPPLKTTGLRLRVTGPAAKPKVTRS